MLTMELHKRCQGFGHPAQTTVKSETEIISWSPYGMSSSQMAPQPVDTCHLDRVTNRSGYSD